MRVLMQRVSTASVTVEQSIIGEINNGLLLLVGIEEEDDQADIDWLCNKIIQMRVFNDEVGKMNRSVKEIEGELLVVSQFTLHASTKKGNRPSFIKAAKPSLAMSIYNSFVKTIRTSSGLKVAEGKFGALMSISLVNEGPVTIWLDSKNKE